MVLDPKSDMILCVACACVNFCTQFSYQKLKGNCHVPLQLQLLLANCLLLTIHVTAIPLGQFYPFGEQSGDNLVGRTLDGSSPNITLPLPFAFFGESYNDIYVSIMNECLKSHFFGYAQ